MVNKGKQTSLPSVYPAVSGCLTSQAYRPRTSQHTHQVGLLQFVSVLGGRTQYMYCSASATFEGPGHVLGVGVGVGDEDDGVPRHELLKHVAGHL